MYVCDAVEMFLQDCKVRDLAPKTLSFYEYVLGGLTAHLGDDAELPAIAAGLRSHLANLRDQPGRRGTPLSPHTRHAHYRGLRAFCRFLHTEGLSDEIRLPAVRQPRANIQPLSPTQVRSILISFNTTRFTGFRDYTLTWLLFDCGIRLAEVAGLELKDVDFDSRGLTVTGKGNQTRWVAFGRKTKEKLWEYLKVRKLRAAESESALFITQGGRQLTPRGVQMIFRRVGQRVGIDGVRISPHTFRHSFALAYIGNGGDAFSLQKLMGHADMATTAKYVHMSTRDLKRQHEKFSPGDRGLS
jgi:integrase/recombinase XerD